SESSDDGCPWSRWVVSILSRPLSLLCGVVVLHLTQLAQFQCITASNRSCPLTPRRQKLRPAAPVPVAGRCSSALRARKARGRRSASQQMVGCPDQPDELVMAAPPSTTCRSCPASSRKARPQATASQGSAPNDQPSGPLPWDLASWRFATPERGSWG